MSILNNEIEFEAAEKKFDENYEVIVNMLTYKNILKGISIKNPDDIMSGVQQAMVIDIDKGKAFFINSLYNKNTGAKLSEEEALKAFEEIKGDSCLTIWQDRFLAAFLRFINGPKAGENYLKGKKKLRDQDFEDIQKLVESEGKKN